MQRKVNLHKYTYDQTLSLWRNIINIRRFKPDVYHVTGGENWIVNFLPTKKTVITVHDIGHYRSGLKGIKKVIFGLIWWRIPIQFTKVRITCISETTKKELIETFNIQSKRISVIPNCINERFARIEAIKPVKNKILFIGTKANKNLLRVAEALENIECQLSILGNPSTEQIEFLKKFNINYEIKNRLSNQEVIKEYNSAVLVMFPSLSEGFGLPIIEAQATNTPIITSNIEPMQSILGHDLSIVNPYSVESIKQMTIRILSDKKHAEKIVQLGNSNVVKYTTKNICNRYLNGYNNIYSMNS